ncbi:MAG: ATP synthase subunit C [Oligosphaeraceae bacterium]
MTTSNCFRFLAAFLLLLTLAAAPALMAQDAAASATTQDAVQKVADAQRPAAFYYAIAASIGIGCLSAGYAVGKIGAAVMGAAAEKPEIMGKAIAFVGLGEGIALFGFLVALFLYTKM